MGFSSVADLNTETITNGKRLITVFNKTVGGSSLTAGRCYGTFTLAGTPSAGAYNTTTLAFQSCSETTTGAIWTGGNVTPDTKHILNFEMFPSVSPPSWFILVDILGFYPGINMNASGAQTTNSSGGINALPNRDGAQDNGVGVMAFLEITTASGATAHNLQITYTNTAGTLGHGLTPTVACTASAIVNHITHSGVAASNYGPFLPITAGDIGITSVQSVNLDVASGQASAASLVLCRPICCIPVATSANTVGRDFLMQCPILPRIPDGACLSLVHFNGAATTNGSQLYGQLTFGWG